MRACLVALALLLAAVFAGDVRAKEAHALPPEFAQVLASAEKVEIYSLEPWFDEDTKEAKWHGVVLLGHATLSGDKARKAATQFNLAVTGWDGATSMCFEPRHGLRVESDGHVYDFVLCYDCNKLEYYRDDKRVAGISASGSSKVLNKLLTDAKVTLSGSVDD